MFDWYCKSLAQITQSGYIYRVQSVCINQLCYAYIVKYKKRILSKIDILIYDIFMSQNVGPLYDTQMIVINYKYITLYSETKGVILMICWDHIPLRENFQHSMQHLERHYSMPLNTQSEALCIMLLLVNRTLSMYTVENKCCFP